MQIVERVGVDYILQNIPAMHRDHRCLSTGSAQLLYIKEASSGITHYGLHLYRLRSSKKDSRSSERSSERSESVLSRSSMDRPAEIRTLDRPSKSAKMAPAEGAPDEASTLERAPTSAEALLTSAADVHTSGTVWLGICGRGIDIYEVFPINPKRSHGN